jgi:glycosyltransferase involved in cell wall biosynthesis
LGNGGAEKLTVELCNELAKNNEVVICSFGPIEDWMIPPTKISPSVKLIKLNVNKKYSLKGLIKLFKVVYQYRPDVIHIHSSFLIFYFMVISLVYKKSKYIQTVHSTITPAYAKQFTILRFFPFFRKKLINVSISESLYVLYRRSFPRFIFKHIDNGLNPLKLTPQHLPVKAEIEKLRKDKKTKVFTAIGSYSAFKNFSMLARVFKELERDGYNVLLLIIGEDSSPDKLNYRLVEKEKGSNTYLLGFKTNVGDYLYYSDALIVSSTKEGMPLVVLEALSMGLPIISTPVGGVMDLVKNSINGFLADDFSADGLFNAVCKFLNTDKKAIENMKKRNRSLFKNKYSVEICAQNYEKLYLDN